MRLTLLALATASLVAATSSGSDNVPGPNVARALVQRQTVTSPPANATGCVQHGDHWHCDGEEGADHDRAAATNSSATAAHDDHDDDDHDHDHDHAATANSTSADADAAAHPGCHKHGDHWHCPEDEASGSTSSASAESGECIIHLGHTHGNCTPEQKCAGTLGSYNMGLHIGSVFIILVGSGLGVAIPLAAKRWRRNPEKESTIFFLARHFGTGIIISTAFIHLLYHGFVMFASECLEGLLHYESTASALAMAAAFITFLLDLAGARSAGGAGHNDDGHVHGVIGGGGEAAMHSETNSAASDAAGAEKALAANAHGHDHDHALTPTSTNEARNAAQDKWQVAMLEAGIIFHSIMIGVTLGAGSGAGWSTLLIVIVFHQFFEGAALGARIALLTISRVRAFLMGLAFALITPVGIAIGIGVRNALAEHPKNAMIAVGVLNSLSAGILLYTAFKLLSVDFVDGPLRRASIPRILAAIGAMVVGMIAMSVLGKWA